MRFPGIKSIPPTAWQLPTGFIVMLLAVLFTQQYKLYEVEQTRVFVYYGEAVAAQLAAVGGVADTVALWLQQFFLYPVAGPAVMAAVYACMAWLLGDVLGRMGFGGAVWRVLCWLPSVVLYAYTEDRVFFMTGHIAMLVGVLGLWLYTVLAGRSRLWGRVAAAVLVPVVAWWASVCVWPMVAGVLIVSVLGRRDYVAAALCLLSAALSVALGMHFCIVTNAAEIFSPDIFTQRTGLVTLMRWVWVAEALLLLLPLLFRRYALRAAGGRMAVAACVVVVVAVGTALYRYAHNESAAMRQKLQRMMFVGDYRGVFDFCVDRLDYYYAANYFCQVMSKAGQLPDAVGGDIVHPQQIILNETSDVIVRQLLMNIYYHIGYISGAQRQAFEYNEVVDGMSRPDALVMLAKTNIIRGDYAVAEKYLDRLSHTLFYRRWAEKTRRLLYDDKAVEADSEYGPRRLALQIGNVPERWTILPYIVRDIARVSPSLPASQYYEAYRKLGAYEQNE